MKTVRFNMTSHTPCYFEKGVTFSACLLFSIGGTLAALFSKNMAQFGEIALALGLGCIFAVANVKFYRFLVSGILQSKSKGFHSLTILMKFIILFLLIISLGSVGVEALFAFFLGSLAFIPGACYHLYCIR